MNAIRIREFGSPSVMRLEECKVPVVGEGQVLVRIHAIGVNPVDTYIRSGNYANKPQLPYTPGMDAAGVVEESRAADVAVGSRVYVGRSVTGTYAQYALCEKHHVFHLPDGVSFEQGAALHVPYFTAYQALVERARVQAGQWVLVHGASGGVGLAAVQIARMLGCRVIGTAGTTEGLELVRAHGAEAVFNHRVAGYIDGIRSLTGHPQGGVNAVIEMLANVNLDVDLGLLAMRGSVVVVGNRGRVEIDARQSMGREASIHGTRLHNATAENLPRYAAAINAGLVSGSLRPVIRRSFSLADAGRAHELVMEPGAGGKIILIP
jgi:NADPH2:quinone reductase